MDLRAEIEKGWEGPSSKRDISVIINEKRLEKVR